MTITQIENIEHLLKTHYGATKVLVDSDRIEVYGSNVESVYVAVVVEHGDEYDVIYDIRDEDLKHVVLRLVKKSKKVVDKNKLMQ